ncbi:MAG: hypothetical protein ACKO96_37350, partial [Flammeovirgaceae bacterium]
PCAVIDHKDKIGTRTIFQGEALRQKKIRLHKKIKALLTTNNLSTLSILRSTLPKTNKKINP